MRHLLWGLAALALLALPLRSAADYLVTDLGNFGGAGLNNAGQVAGATPDGTAVLYSGGTLTTLGTFTPIAINASGQVVGTRPGFSLSSPDAFVLYSGGTLRDLVPPGGSLFNFVTALNETAARHGGEVGLSARELVRRLVAARKG